MSSNKLFIIVIPIIAIAIGLFLIFNHFFHNEANILSKPDQIILVTLDTLRTDHLSIYGYPRPTSPFIDNLAQNSFVFKKAFSSIASTSPSHASIMTSLHPVTHNVLSNTFKLDSSITTLAEYFKQLQFLTAGFVSTNRHFKPCNLDQGFDVFNEQPYDERFYRPANETVDETLQWLRRRKPKSRYFLWVHLFDPHTPYSPPEEMRQSMHLTSPQEKKEFIQYLKEVQKVDIAYYNNEEELLNTYENYDAEIFFVDQQVKRLYQFIMNNKLAEKSLWIITSDHGEGLGNHRWAGHGKHIYNEQINVLMMFHFSWTNRAGLEIYDITEHVDIFPTITELLNKPLKLNYKFAGFSLIPLIQQRNHFFAAKYAFSQRRHFNFKPQKIIHEKTDYEDGVKFSLQDRSYKYIFRSAHIDEFYDLSKDPYETYNLIDIPIPERDKMRKILFALREYYREGGKFSKEEISQEAIERLKALGYIQ